jgi:hypothetical protein
VVRARRLRPPAPAALGGRMPLVVDLDFTGVDEPLQRRMIDVV